jgi:hypothetical protein
MKEAATRRGSGADEESDGYHQTSKQTMKATVDDATVLKQLAERRRERGEACTARANHGSLEKRKEREETFHTPPIQ